MPIPEKVRSGGISVVIPVLDEALNVGPLLAEIRSAIDATGIAWEVVFVDDASSDGTGDAIRAAAGGDERVRIVRFERTSGQTVGIVAGVKAARHPMIVTLDGDRQQDPQDIPEILAHLDEGDVVVGWRASRQDTWGRRFVSRGGNFARRILTGDPTHDSGCSLKAFPRDLFLDLPRFVGMHRFLSTLFHAAGARIVEIPVRHRPRPAGRSKYGTLTRFFRVVLDLAGIFWLRLRWVRYRVVDPERPGKEPAAAAGRASGVAPVIVFALAAALGLLGAGAVRAHADAPRDGAIERIDRALDALRRAREAPEGAERAAVDEATRAVEEARTLVAAPAAGAGDPASGRMAELLWVGFGFAAQSAFFARFLVQWIASERRGRSYVPVSFWWISIVGGTMLFAYALHRNDPVFIAGQGVGLLVYVRNLMLVRRRKAAVA